MHPLVIVQLLVLLTLANSMPVVAKRFFGGRFTTPLDGGVRFFDGRPLLGESKTIRGVVLAVGTTTVAAPAIGLDWTIGALVGSLSMLGDLFSSFCKRRLDVQPSGKATGLDQIPESLLPLLACVPLLSLTALDVIAGVIIFFAGEVALSPLFFRLGIRDRPY